MTDTTSRRTPREVFALIQRATLDKDMSALADLYAPDAVHEWPFPPVGLAGAKLQGAEQIRKTLEAAGKSTVLDFRKFGAVDIYDTADPEVAVIEYELGGVVTATGKDFLFRYIMVLRVRDGLIVSLRDYFNPVANAAATGRLAGLAESAAAH
jgi:ketosteroid isomerase-like protein